jgi:hypothetical protein
LGRTLQSLFIISLCLGVAQFGLPAQGEEKSHAFSVSLELTHVDIGRSRATADFSVEVEVAPTSSFIALPLPIDLRQTSSVGREPGSDYVPFFYGRIPSSSGLSAVMIPPQSHRSRLRLLLVGVPLSISRTTQSHSDAAIELPFDEASREVVSAIPSAEVLALHSLRYGEDETVIEQSLPEARLVHEEHVISFEPEDERNVVLFLRPSAASGWILLFLHLTAALFGIAGALGITNQFRSWRLAFGSGLVIVVLVLVAYLTIPRSALTGDLTLAVPLAGLSGAAGFAVMIAIRALQVRRIRPDPIQTTERQ